MDVARHRYTTSSAKIAAYFDARCSEIDKVIETKQSIIADLKAHKQSLIYEIVTGKREK